MKGSYYASDKYEVIELSNGDAYLRDLETHKYYFKNNLYVSKSAEFIKVKDCAWEIQDTFNLMLILISAALLIFMLFKSTDALSIDTEAKSDSIVILLMFVLFNLIMHEVGHSMMLNSFGRLAGKYSFRLKGIFPVVIVDTTDAYMLPIFRKICVFLAGICSNIIICWGVFCFIPSLHSYINVVLMFIIFNLLPIGYLKTDGYNVLVSLIKKNKKYTRYIKLYNTLCKWIIHILSVMLVYGVANIYL